MSRKFTPEVLIDLPILSAPWAYVLIAQVTGAADAQQAQLAAIGQSLNRYILDGLTDLKAAYQALGVALQPVLAQGESAKKTADTSLDKAWRSLYNFLLSCLDSDASGNPDPEGTQRLFDLLFSDGLTFITAKYEIEWQETQARLNAIAADPSLGQTLSALGGDSRLASLQKAQAAYGTALGITQPLDPAVTAALKSALNNASHLLRAYILHVASFAVTRDLNAQTIADALLEPYVNWVSPIASSSSSATASASTSSATASGASTSSTTADGASSSSSASAPSAEPVPATEPAGPTT